MSEVSNKLAIITVIQSEEELQWFSRDCLHALHDDTHFSALINTIQFEWHLITPSKLCPTDLQSTAQTLGFTFSFTYPKSSLENEPSIYAQYSENLIEQSYDVVILKPDWSFSESPFLLLTHAIKKGALFCFLPSIHHSSITGDPNKVDSFFQHINRHFSAKTTTLSVEANVLYFKFSQDYVAIQNSNVETFFLSSGLATSEHTISSILTFPSQYMSYASRWSIREAPLIFTQRVNPSQMQSISLESRELDSGFWNQLCCTLAADLKKIQSFFSFGVFLQRPETLEPMPSECCSELSFFTNTLLQRIQGYALGMDLPATTFHLPHLFAEEIKFEHKKHVTAKPLVPQNQLIILNDLISTHTVNAFEQSFGLSMQSRIYQFILKRLNKYIPILKKHFDTAQPNIAIYGAGSHTETLYNLWQQLGGTPISAILLSTSSDFASFQGVPVKSIQQCKKDEFDLIILSSATYEREMARNCSEFFPKTNVLSIWHPEYTQLVTIERTTFSL